MLMSEANARECTAPVHRFVLPRLCFGLHLVLVLSIAVLVLDVCIVLRGILSGHVTSGNPSIVIEDWFGHRHSFRVRVPAGA